MSFIKGFLKCLTNFIYKILIIYKTYIKFIEYKNN